MGRVILKLNSAGTMLNYCAVADAKPETLYQTRLRGGEAGPFTLTKLVDGKTAFLLPGTTRVTDIETLVETPPLERIEATDGTSLDRPTPRDAYKFLAKHTPAGDVTLFV
jgi:hypothetical protein